MGPLEAWAERHGVSALLDRSLGEAMPTYYGFLHRGVSALDPSAPLRSLFEPPAEPHAPSLESERRNLASFARRMLREAAQARAEGQARASSLLASLAQTGGEVEPSARLSLRLLGSAGRLVVQPLVQKRAAGGRWSQGAVVPAERVARGAEGELSPLDEQIAALLADEVRLPSSPSARRGRRRTLLELLSRHPRVVIGSAEGDAPARVEPAELTLSFSACPVAGDRWQSVLHAGTTPASASSLLPVLDERGFGALLDEGRAAVVLLDVGVAGRAALELLSSSPSLAREQAVALASALDRPGSGLRVVLPGAIEPRRVAADPRPVVRLEPRSPGALEISLGVRPFAGEPLWPPGSGPSRVSGRLDGEPQVAERDLEAERSLAAELASALGLSGEGPWARAGEAALSLLEALERAASEGGDRFSIERPASGLPRLAETGELRVRVEGKGERLLVDGGLEAGGTVLPLGTIVEALASKRRFVEVEPGTFVALSGELRARLVSATAALRRGKAGLEASALSLLSVGGGASVRLEADRASGLLLDRARAALSSSPPMPEGLRAELRPYQREGVAWLLRLGALGAGGCLADEMGLGKTVQALGLLLGRAELGPQLVVAPTSVGPGWLAEAARFAPSLEVSLYRGPGRGSSPAPGPGQVLVASYDVLARDADRLSEMRFATLVLDEAQCVKNARSKRAQAARAIDAGCRVALTGTPVENHLGELWSVFHVVAPSLLGPWQGFHDRFAQGIERDGDGDLRAALARLLRPFLLRRTRAEVASELPERVEVLRLVEPSAEEQALYEGARRSALSLLASGSGRAEALAALTRLRMLCCHPRLVDRSWHGPSSKLRAFVSLFAELAEQGHRALIFSQFTSHLALVREALERSGEAVLYLDGETPQDERTRRIAAFQRGEARAFLISLRAGGTGLNLTAADTVVHLDPWWNPATEEQASSRAYRLGQERKVTVVRLVVRGTIEEAVVRLQEGKRELALALLDGEREALSQMGDDELARLLLG